MERSENSSKMMVNRGNLHTAVTLVSGLGLGVGIAVAALAFIRKQQEARVSSVDSIVAKCKEAANNLEARLEKGIGASGIKKAS